MPHGHDSCVGDMTYGHDSFVGHESCEMSVLILTFDVITIQNLRIMIEPTSLIATCIYIYESCLLYMSHVSHQWVMSPIYEWYHLWLSPLAWLQPLYIYLYICSVHIYTVGLCIYIPLYMQYTYIHSSLCIYIPIYMQYIYIYRSSPYIYTYIYVVLYIYTYIYAVYIYIQ